MVERRWMGHDWQPTISDPEKKVSSTEAKDIYLRLLHEKLRQRVDAGEISQSEMDTRFIRLGVDLPVEHLFPSAELKSLGINRVTVSQGNLEMCAEIMANSVETKGSQKEEPEDDSDRLN